MVLKQYHQRPFETFYVPTNTPYKRNKLTSCWRKLSEKKGVDMCDSVLPLCCGGGLSLAHHRQRTASRCHFLFDLPRNQVAGFHSQEVDAWLEPHPAERDEETETRGERELERVAEKKKKRESEVNLKFTQAHHKQKRKESWVVTVTVRGICLKLNSLRLEFPCPDFLADFL